MFKKLNILFGFFVCTIISLRAEKPVTYEPLYVDKAGLAKLKETLLAGSYSATFSIKNLCMLPQPSFLVPKEYKKACELAQEHFDLTLDKQKKYVEEVITNQQHIAEINVLLDDIKQKEQEGLYQNKAILEVLKHSRCLGKFPEERRVEVAHGKVTEDYHICTARGLIITAITQGNLAKKSSSGAEK